VYIQFCVVHNHIFVQLLISEIHEQNVVLSARELFL